MTITSAAGSAGCGCGPGPAPGGTGYGSATAGCACGGGGTPCTGGCRKQGTPRPRFFAGQLLTEDDLEALTAYVTAKSRLHTRYLAGAGVVCGLEVACPPCGGGTIRVQPGYALDCCGRDIVLACPVDLDINAMIRDLRLSQLGTDCGDPCPPASTTAAGTAAQGQEPVRHYCLYVRYDEQLTDPVAPYVTEEPCGLPACEPTRVYEGYQFLLRCRSDRPSPVTISDRLLVCLPSSDVTRLADGLAKYAVPLHEAAERAETLPFDSQALVKATSALTGARESITALSPEEAQTIDGMIRDVAAELARLQLQDEAARQQIIKDNQKAIEMGQAELLSAATVMAGAPEGTWPQRLDRRAADALVTQALQLADPGAGPLDPVEARMLAQNAPFDRDVWSVLADDATVLRDWLLGRLDNDPLLTDCELRTAAERIRIPDTDPGADEAITRAAAGATSRLADTLNELVGRYERDCVCAAINPPCPPCDDDAVLLACLDVRDCAVVRICSTVRDWVVSGPTLRYWIPQLAGLHQLLEAFCCGEDSPRERNQRLDQLAAAGRLPAPLATALGGSAAPPVTEQLGALWAEIHNLAGQVASTRRSLSTEKARITNLSRPRKGRGTNV